MAQHSEVLKFVIRQLEGRLKLLSDILELLKTPFEPILTKQQFLQQYQGLTEYHYGLYAFKMEAILATQKFQKIREQLQTRRTQLDRLHKQLSYDLGLVRYETFLDEVKYSHKEKAYLQDVLELAIRRKSRYEEFKKDDALTYQKMRIDNMKANAVNAIFNDITMMCRAIGENATTQTLPMPPNKNRLDTVQPATIATYPIRSPQSRPGGY